MDKRAWGPLFTLATLGVIELLARKLNLPPNPAPIYLAVVYATFSGGLLSGLLSAGLTLVYAWHAIHDQASLLMVMVTSPGIALMVGLLKRRSDRREAEQVRARLVAILEATPDLVATAGADGHLLYVNAAGRRLLGLGQVEDVSEMRLADVLSEPGRRPFQVEGIPAAVSRGVWTGDTTLRARDGRETPVSLLLLAHKSPEGLVEFYSAIARDVGERRRLEEQVRQSQKMEAVGRLAGGVAHDFNNLLTVILSHAGFLAKDLPAEVSLREDVEQVQNAARRAAALTRQLLIFSRREVSRPVPLDLNRAVEEIAKLLRRTLGETVELIVEPATDLRCVKADPGQVEQVLVNLAVNARDAMPEGGRLTLSTALHESAAVSPTGLPAGRYVRLTVADTGCGMAPEVASRAFEPFFTTKERGKGTGLGLATVYGIVRQAGGDIAFTTAPGRGTVFTVLLPVTDEPAPPAGSPDGTAPTGKGETVLVVEDEDAVRAIACRILTRGGYRVREARHGAEALDLLGRQEGPLHLLLTDMVMPQVSGHELAQRARAQRPGLPVLFMSGYADKAELNGDGVESLIQKPFTEEALLARVRKALDGVSGGRA